MGIASARSFFSSCYVFCFALLITSFVTANEAQPSSPSFGAAAGFNAFVIEDFVFLSSTVEGRLAVGGNLSLQHFSVGDKLDSSTLHDVVLVGGNVTFPSGKIYHGNLRAGGSIVGVGDAVLYGMATGASVQGHQTLPIDFAAEHEYLKTLSQNIGNLPANGNVALQWGGFYLTGDCTSDLQVFSIDANVLKTVHTFAVSCIPANATVIFNIYGTESTIQNVGFQSLTAIRNKVLFNFPQATSIKLTSVGIEGSMLAPYAQFNNPAGNISGQLIARSWKSTNYGYVSITNHKFTGDLSAVLPSGPINSKPVITSSPALEVIAGDVHQYQILATDSDPQDVLTYTLVAPPSGMEINAGTGQIIWPTTSAAIGVHQIHLQVTDLSGASDSQVYALNVLPPNRAPVITSTPPTSGMENQLYSYSVIATDADNDSLSYSINSAQEGISINAQTGVVQWLPNYDAAGDYTIVVTVSDGQTSATQSYTLTINNTNRAPEFTSAPVIQGQENQAYVYSASATDPDGDLLSYSIVSAPSQVNIDSDSGLITWLPQFGDSGTHPIAVQVDDGQGATATQTFTLTILARENGAPVITSSPALEVIAGDVYQYQILATDSDPQDVLTYTLVAPPSGMEINEDTGQIVWLTTSAAIGVHQIHLQVTDLSGASDSQVYALNVLPPNRAPVITSTPPTSGMENQLYSYSVIATDADNDSLSYSINSAQEGISINAQTGVVQWLPNYDAAGDYTIVVTVSDGQTSATQSYTLTINNTNRAPEFTSSPVVQGRESQAYVYSASATDLDGDLLSYRIVSAPSQVNIDSDSGLMTWLPQLGDSGTHPIAIQVDDGQGATATQTFTLTISARENGAPVITSSPQLEVTTGDVYEYLVTASDPDDDVLVYTLLHAPSGMVIDPTTGTTLWHTVNTDIGPHEIQIQVADSAGNVDVQTFQLAVTARENRPPEFISSPVTAGSENQPYHYVAQASDVDGDAILYALTESPIGMSIDPLTGSIDWLPDYLAAGSYSVAVRASDANGAEAFQRFDLVIGSVNRPPVITSDPIQQATSGSLYRYIVEATDPDGDKVSFTLASAPETMTIDPETGESLWLPGEGHLGEHPVEVVVSDSLGATVTQTFMVSVIVGNQPPIITSTPISVATAGLLYSYPVTAVDPEGEAVELELVEAPAGMTLDVSGETLRWANPVAGTYPVTLAATDPHGLQATQHFALEVSQGQPLVTHLGTDFWAMFNTRGKNAGEDETFAAFYASATQPGTVRVECPALNIDVSFPLEPNKVVLMDMTPYLAETVFHALGVQPHALRVTSDVPIALHLINRAPHSSDATLVFPVTALGRDYYAVGYAVDYSWAKKSGWAHDNYIGIVATEDNTRVVITPADILTDNPSARLTTPYEILLQRGESYQATGPGGPLGFHVDVTGTLIKADKPIAVFSGAKSAGVNENYGDHLVEQIPPIGSWGSVYQTLPLASRFRGDNFRMLAAEDDTYVWINDTLAARLDAGKFYETVIEGPASIVGSKPLLVTQFSNGELFDSGDRSTFDENADPFMVVVPPVEQFISHYTIDTPVYHNLETGELENIYLLNFVNLIAPKGALDSIRVDGQPIDAALWRDMPDANYAGIQLPISHGQHTLSGDQPFGLYVYGFAPHESYGYIGGMALSDSKTVASLTVAPDKEVPQVGETLCLNAQLRDAQGNPVTQTQVAFKRQFSGMERDANRLTDAAGRAAFCYSATEAGQETLTVTAQAHTNTLALLWRVYAGAGNQPPQFVSQPVIYATPGAQYQYQVLASDANQDALEYSVIEGPENFTVDPATGLAQWQVPVDFQEICWITPIYTEETFVTLQVSDGTSSSQQRYRLLTTPGANHYPQFTSTPVTHAVAGRLYQYRLFAADVDNHPVFDGSSVIRIGLSEQTRSYQLLQVAPGMTFISTAPNLNLVQWHPTEAVVGDHVVELQVTDSLNASTTQSYVLTVEPNYAPVFTSTPGLVATTRHQYLYRVAAIDANGDRPYFNLEGPQGMVLRSDGLLLWTPGATQAGVYPVVITADDQYGGLTTQTFELTVSANQAPVFTSEPPLTAIIGRQYRYIATVTDPENDPVTLNVVSGPPGLTVNSQKHVNFNPGTALMGSHDVVISAQDAFGGYTEQAFTLIVTANHAPQFTSKPVYGAKVGTGYVYLMAAVDGDGDAVSYRRITGPFGIGLIGNGLTWSSPTMTNGGVHNVTVQAYDNFGGSSEQSYTITVSDGTLRIIHHPGNATLVDSEAFAFTIEAIHPQDLPVQFSLTQAPAGMVINSASGLLEWTPTASQVGAHPVTLRASDNAGLEDNVSFTLQVTENTNQAPVIHSLPPTTAAPGQAYSYIIEASDPEDHALSYSLALAPAGMTLTGTTINWLPTAADEGEHPVKLVVTDERNKSSEQEFVIRVRVNLAPEVLGTPFTSAAEGYEYHTLLQAMDPNDDPLTFAVQSVPDGFTIDADSGQIRWTPTAAQVGEHLIEVTISDGEFTIIVRWTIRVSADLVPIDLHLTVSPSIIELGEQVTITVATAGGVAQPELELTVDGAVIALDAQGQAQVTGSRIGRHDVVVSADDGSQQHTETTWFSVADPSDTEPPVVALLSPIQDSSVTALTDVIGSVQDANLADVRLAYTRPGSGEWIDLYRGTDTFNEEFIAQFDPTSLLNGMYQLVLQATDINGAVTTAAVTLVVEGDMKVGNFSFTVQDLLIPVSGIPIRVTRTYDSRRRHEGLDFGYGWSVGYQDAKVDESSEPTERWYQEQKRMVFKPISSYPFEANATCTYPRNDKTVTVTLPDGAVERFTAHAQIVSGSYASLADPDCYLLGGRHVALHFEAEDGTDSTLEAPGMHNLYLTDLENGNLTNDITGTTATPVFRYRLTTRLGYIYDLNQNFGIEKVTDPNGHTLTYTDNGIFHSDGKNVLFNRDGDGRITGLIDPKGEQVMTYTYDGKGDLQSATDSLGAATGYRYNTRHGLTEIIDPLGRPLLKNLYDEAGRLIAQEDNQGRRIQFDHDLEGRQSIVTNRNGYTNVLYYDERGNVLNQIDALGGITRYSYDERDNQLSETNPLGFTQTATFNYKDDQLTATDAAGNTVAYVYNERGQETTITDARGNSFTNAYDAVGNLLSITDPLGNTASNLHSRGLVTRTTDLLGHTTDYTYDSTGNKLTETNAQGQVTTYTYDDNGNVLSEARTRTSTSGATVTDTTTYAYDSRDRVIRSTDALGHTTHTEYDLAGNQSASIDALGRRTEMDYDAYGRLIATHYPDGTTETSSYDAEGNQLSETDRAGRTTRHDYDGLNRLIRTTYANGSSTETDYDAAGRVIAQTDALGNTTTYGYDAAGRRTSTTDALGNSHDFSYDEEGNLVGEIDALGRVTTYTYNALDQKVSASFHDHSGISTALDAMGNKTASTDQAGITTTYGYDALNRLIRVTDTAGNATTFTYDEAGNKLSQTDAENRTTRWEYDALGRQRARILPLGQRENFAYDAVGNLTSHTDFNGNTTTHTYDPDNDRLMETHYADGRWERFSYDTNGNRLSATQTDAVGASRITTYAYDSQDRLVEEVQPNGHRLSYVYDANGNRTRVTLTRPLGNPVVTDYGFDALNRLSTVTDASGTTTYQYDAVGNRTRVTYPNGTSQRYHYDSLNRLTMLDTLSALNALLQRFDYTLHPTGRRTQIEELNGRTTTYGYDNLYRLTGENITDPVNGNYSAEYTYDKVGNRVYETIDGVSTAYTFDVNDRLTQTGGKTFVYDHNGNTLSETLDGVTTSYTYNSQNQLVETTKDGITTTYRYNAEGIRTGQGNGTTETTYVVDQNRDYAQVLLEANTTGNNTDTVIYTYGDDLISQNRNSSTSYYHYDGLGSTRALSDASGSLTDTYAYEAFGTLLNQAGETENNYLFTGEQYDPNLNQYYLRARYYNQTIGRFTQQDTWMGNNYDPITLHKYLYANVDPGNMVDPTGMFSGTMGGLMTGIQGLAIQSVGAVGRVGAIGFAANDAVFVTGVALSSKQIGLLALASMGAAGSLLDSLNNKNKRGEREYVAKPAALINGAIKVFPKKLDFMSAVIEAKAGGDLMAKSKDWAFKIAFVASGARHPGPAEIHGKTGGFRYHYHIKPRTPFGVPDAHIWY